MIFKSHLFISKRADSDHRHTVNAQIPGEGGTGESHDWHKALQ
ncbi:hypothetical protein P886_4718 [Alteromonadaceae bacterium 2753L.S.0a.02]|nr:hypothetical protein P886_4718 [Alteromonadaceae bacterium 2753L.S.0a.02]